MRKTILWSALFGAILVSEGAADTVQGFVYAAGTFTEIQLPGLPQGINDAGQIVGFLQPGAQGFLYSGGTVTPIVVPGAVYTSAWDINNSGQIVGSFLDSHNVQKAYLYDAGTFITIDLPGEGSALGLSDAGQVVGNFGDANGVHGFLYDAGTLTIIDVPGQSFTEAFDINDAGQIVGWYDDGTRRHNFLYDAGTFTTIDVPGSPFGYTSGINDLSQIVGAYSDGTRYHGFLYDAGSFTTIDIPGRHILPEGINDAGQIVGWSLEIPVPEPGSMLMLGWGLAGILAFASQKRRSG